MELHAFDRMDAVAESHDEAGIGLRGRDKRVWQPLTIHDQGVVADCLEVLGQAREDALAIVVDARGLSVDDFWRADHPAAKRLTH